MHVSVVYALPDEQFLEELEVPEASTVEQVLMLSQVFVRFPDIDLNLLGGRTMHAANCGPSFEFVPNYVDIPG